MVSTRLSGGFTYAKPVAAQWAPGEVRRPAHTPCREALRSRIFHPLRIKELQQAGPDR
jgi:hypothetical protein